MIKKALTRIELTSSQYVGTFLFFLTFLLYFNTLFNGLFFDDEHFIYDNPYVRSFSIGDFFTKSLTSESGEVSNYYRPLLFLSFSIQYQLFGDLGFIFHLTSFAIHALNGILLYILLKKLFGNTIIAFLTSILFIIHPIQTEAVSYAAGFGDPLSFFFMMLTILFSFQKNKKHILSFLFLICALLSKEIALITPFLIFISHLVLQKTISKQTLVETLKKTAHYFVIALAYFILRITLLNFNNTLNFYGFENEYSKSLFIRLNTFFNLLPLYFQLLFFPKDLFIERDATIQIYKTITPLSIALFTLFGGLTYASIKYFKKLPILFFSIFWFIISFGPTSGIIPINGIFYEHFLYFPSVGFFLIVSSILYWLLTHKSKLLNIITTIILIAAIVGLSLRTIIRNNDWNNAIAFYKETLKYTQTARIYNNLAMSYSDEKEYQNAIKTYQKAIQLSDTYSETHYNLANAYAAIGNVKKAEEEYRKSLKINNEFYLSYLKLFALYKNKNNSKEIEEIIKDVEELANQNPNFLPLLEEIKKQSNNI